MKPNTKITRCKYLHIGLLCLMPLGISSICAAQETAQVPMTATQMDEEFPIPAPKQDSSDSYDLLVMAGKSIDHDNEGPPGAPAVSPAEDLRKQRAFIMKNAASLETMHEALQQPIVAPAGRDFDELDLGGGALRRLMRLAMQRNRVAAADKQWQVAFDGALDIMQTGIEIEKNAAVIGMLESVSIQDMGRADMWNWIEPSDAAAALSAAQRLEQWDAKTPDFVATMTEEKWSGLLRVEKFLTFPDWQAFRQAKAEDLAKFLQQGPEVKQLLQISDREILRHYLTTMDAVLAQAALPFSLNPDPIARAADPISDSGTSSYTDPKKRSSLVSSRAIMEKSRAENRLLMTALALHAFQKDNNRYPEKLDELRGKYLQEVPSDPFGADTPLRYKIEGEKYLLYSIGPDGVDNGGVAPKSAAPDKDGVVPRPAFNAPGDLLAGQKN